MKFPQKSETWIKLSIVFFLFTIASLVSVVGTNDNWPLMIALGFVFATASGVCKLVAMYQEIIRYKVADPRQ